MIQGIVSSGSAIIDELIGGGLETDIITTFYGQAGSGKSNIALCAAVAVAKSGKRVLFIDTEASFSYTRLEQMAGKEEARALLEQFVFLRPTSFEEQKRAFARLPDINFSDIGIIIVDSIAMLYRLEMGRAEISEVNRELSIQIGILTEIARKRGVPVLVTNQVYSVFDERDKIAMSGGDILKYGSKCLVELRILNNKRKAILIKHRSQPEGKTAYFQIVEKGLQGIVLSKETEERPIAI